MRRILTPVVIVCLALAGCADTGDADPDRDRAATESEHPSPETLEELLAQLQDELSDGDSVVIEPWDDRGGNDSNALRLQMVDQEPDILVETLREVQVRVAELPDGSPEIGRILLGEASDYGPRTYVVSEVELSNEDCENMLSLALHGPCGQYLLLDQSGQTTLEVDCAVEDQGAASLVDSIPALIEDATRDLPNIDQIT